MRGDPRICLLDLEVCRDTEARVCRLGGQLGFVLSSLGEAGDRGKGLSREVFMCYGSVKMGRFV